MLDFDRFSLTGKIAMICELRDSPIQQYLCKHLFYGLNDGDSFMRDMPTLNFNNDICKELLSKNKDFPQSRILNHYKYVVQTNSKLEFHKKFDGCHFIPKTVFDKSEIHKLKFPIIAKIDKGSAGKGLKKFENKKDFNEYMENPEFNFSVFSECTNISKEFMIFFYGNKILACYQRHSNSDKYLKTAKSRTDFDYEKIHIDSLGTMMRNALYNMRNYCMDVKFLSMDVMIDENNDLFLIELNSKSGLVDDVGVLLYKEMYEEFYGRNLLLDELIEYHSEKIKSIPK